MKTTTINEKTKIQSERLTIRNFELEIRETMFLPCFFEISLWMIQNFNEARRIFVRVHEFIDA